MQKPVYNLQHCTDHPLTAPTDDRKRPLILIWVAAPAIAGLAYMRVFQRPQTDPVYLVLHWTAFAMALVAMWAAYRPYLGRLKFGMYYWAASFPSAGLAVTAQSYYHAFPGGMSYGIAVTSLAATTVIQMMLLMHTLIDILLQRVGGPRWASCWSLPWLWGCLLVPGAWCLKHPYTQHTGLANAFTA
jgi:hypothetical protein